MGIAAVILNRYYYKKDSLVTKARNLMQLLEKLDGLVHAQLVRLLKVYSSLYCVEPSLSHQLGAGLLVLSAVLMLVRTEPPLHSSHRWMTG